MAFIEEGVLSKTGPELFKELLRVYPIAEYEDYTKGNMWKDDLMRMDLKLIYAHAREAGAPYPPALDQVKLPPGCPKAPGVSAVRPLGTALGLRPGATPIKVAGRPPVAAGAAAPGAAAAAAAVAPNPAAELRLIALFVAKWKLDPTKTKVHLAKLNPARRRYVISNFKTAVQGAEAAAELEKFIGECESTDAWANAAVPATVATPAAGAAPAAGTAPAASIITPTGGIPATGLKRPLATTIAPTNPALDATKRPRLGVVTAVAPKNASVLKPGILAGPRAVTPPKLPGGLVRGPGS